MPTEGHEAGTAPGELAPLADLVAERADGADGTSVLVGLAGAVAVGKSTTSAHLGALLADRHGLATAVVASDGFLLPNAELLRRGLTERKGFPDSYDATAIERFVAEVRAGCDPLHVPVYDHLFYDVQAERRSVALAPVVVLEGVNVLHFADAFDVRVYVDAAEPDVRRWFVARVLALRDEAAGVPGAYLAPFAGAPDEAVAAMAEGVWEAINLPNLREAIEPTRERADVVVVKGADHAIREVRVR
jgi:type I pantothenate kinase